MFINEVEEVVKDLLRKAQSTRDGGEALRFTQAANNAANTAFALENAKSSFPSK